MERGVSIVIDPTGAQTGGRVVKRELKEIGDAAISTQKRIDQLTIAQEQMAKSAKSSAQTIIAQQDAMREKLDQAFAAQQRYARAIEGINNAQRLGAITASQMIDLRIKETNALNAQISALNSLASRQKAAAQSAVDRVTITPNRGADIAAYGAELDRLQAKYDPMFAATQRYTRTLEEVDRATRVGAISASQAIEVRLREKAALDAVASAAQRLSSYQKALAQTVVDQRTITPDRAADVAAYGQELDSLRAKFSPLYAVTTRYLETKAEIQRAHRVGAISSAEMAAALSRERQATLTSISALKSHTVAIQADNAAMRMASFQRRNLVFQLNDIAVSLASGMNPLMVMAQQGSQIGQIYMGQGGVVTALKETANMAGQAASRFGRWGAVLAPVALGLGHIKKEAEAALRSSVTWGEVMTATFQTIWEGLKNTFGPAVSTLLEPLFYAFDKLSSAAVDVGELVINSFRAAYEDVKFIWNQFPNMMGAAFVGAVNFAIRELNSLIKRNADAVDQIIGAFNRIPGVDIPTIGASDQTIPEQRNSYAEALARAAQQRNADIESIMSSTPLRDFGASVVDRIGTNRARSRLADFADMDIGASIQATNSLGQAVGGVNTAWQQAKSTVIDVNQQMMDARRSMLAGFEQSSKQLRTMKSELKDIQATLAAAAQTPVSDVFGASMSGEAAGSIAAAASSIQKVFAALNDGRVTAQTAHESLELIRASLHQLGGDTASVDLFIDKMIKGYLHVGNLESRVKSLSASIAGIPNRTISIGIQQYTVGTAGGGTKGVNVYGGQADFSYSQYQVGGGKTVGVSAGNGSYGGQSGYYYDSPYDLGILQDMGRLSGTRAAGGPVSAGGTYLVGENGPELLTMQGGGQVTNTNSTAAILSGGRDTLSLIEDHLYNVVQELRIHTNYWESAESDFTEMVACLKSLKSAVSSGGGSYSGGSSYSRGSSRGSYGGSSGSSGGQSHLDPYSPYYFNAARNFAGTGGGRYDPVADAMLNGNVGALAGVGQGPGYFGGAYLSSINIGGAGSSPTLLDRLKRQVGFANNGQIMPGEDQKVEFFKRNKERVIIVDDNRVSDQRGGGRQPARSERPINLTVNFNGGAPADARSRQAAVDDVRRTVLQVMQSR